MLINQKLIFKIAVLYVFYKVPIFSSSILKIRTEYNPLNQLRK